MKLGLSLLAMLVLVSAPCAGQLLWADDFENNGWGGSPPGPYAVGPVPSFPAPGGYTNPQNGGWDVWFQNPAAAGRINTNFNHTPGGSRSLEVSGAGVGGSGCDIVQWHQGASAAPGNPGLYNPAFGPGGYPGQTPGGPPGLGAWQYRAWNYIPSGFPTGTASHYFIVNDQYNHASTAQWILQIQFNHVAGTVSDDQRATNAAPIVYDQWVELIVTIDLDNQCLSAVYNCIVIASGPLYVAGWHGVPSTVPPQIANLDLYTVGATSYWDDITLVRVPNGPFFTLNDSTMSADINGVQGTTCAPAQTNLLPGQPMSARCVTSVGALFDAAIALPSAVSISGTSPNGAGGVALAANEIVNVPLTGGLLFLNGGLGPSFLPHPGVVQIQAPPGALQPGIVLAIQWFALDPTSPVGLNLSQCCQLRVR
jgi:hypothetical protein